MDVDVMKVVDLIKKGYANDFTENYKAEVVDNIHATHWIALQDEINYLCTVTVGKCYKLIYDLFAKEYRILDDNQEVNIYNNFHNGIYIKLEEREDRFDNIRTAIESRCKRKSYIFLDYIIQKSKKAHKHIGSMLRHRI
ncbi:hypothetical protein G8T75_12795 [Clostridium botulinum D/C]|uniref:hypothetical protein n=1 Tax=Clostridium botulinum TaxID=1491 RepID=UPI001E3D300B|nr:hypothetical protein [Clostridium botulinum]MCD3240835.1 hypothetical protein [Clostridium botulinum D/C]